MSLAKLIDLKRKIFKKLIEKFIGIGSSEPPCLLKAPLPNFKQT